MNRKQLGKRWMATFLAFALMIGTLTGTGVGTKVAEAAKKSKLNKKSMTLLVGKSQKLKVLKKQKGAKYSWKSSKKKIAKVTSNGKVTGVKKGNAKIVCSVSGKGKTYKLNCKVEVVKGATKVAIVLDGSNKAISSVSLFNGEEAAFSAKLTPKSSNDKITWKSNNKKVVKIDQWGNATAVGMGNATITATSLSKKKATVKVTVEALSISSNFKDAYADYFSMGAAVNLVQLRNQTDLSHVLQHYNSITLENEMKPEAILGGNSPTLVNKSDAEFPVPDSYKEEKVPLLDFSKVDAVMEIAKANNLKMRGHTLVWHSQTPSWFFKVGYSSSGQSVSKEVMDARMEFYIQQVLTHVKEKYPGILYAWDVVNEAFENDGNEVYSKGLRAYSPWYNIYKDDSYIINAFKFARKYQEKESALFYNDYNEYIENKTNNICTLAEKLKKENLIDGIGMQAHLDIGFPTVEQIGTAIDKFSALGLQIQLTELDVTIAGANQYKEQGEFYKNLFTMLVEKKNKGAKITNVTFWGLSDRVSWRGSQSPLLFTNGSNVKPAAIGVLAAVGK